VPVLNTSTSKTGLLNLVDGSFKSQVEGNDFTSAEYINKTGNYFINTDASGNEYKYQTLEYLESTGTQYINTGILYDNSKNYRLKANLAFTTVTPNNQILGFTGNMGMGIGTVYDK
jgi:hypothetical protein